MSYYLIGIASNMKNTKNLNNTNPHPNTQNEFKTFERTKESMLHFLVKATINDFLKCSF
jgi:hypothetical protein